MAGPVQDVVTGIIKPIADIGADAARQTSTDSAVENVGPDFNRKQMVDTAKNIPVTTTAAQEATKKIGEVEKKAFVPQGVKTEGQGNTSSDASLQLVETTKQNYDDATEAVNTAALKVEDQKKVTQAAATIDPQRYINNLGVDKRTITSIGLVLSGIGSGLAGQKNMAMDVLQKNIDRDIAAQETKFKQQADLLAKQQGLLLTTQQRQQNAIIAHNMAVISVSSGVQTAFQGTNMKAAGGSAEDKAIIINNELELKKAAAQNQIDSIHMKTFQSQDVKSMNALGLAYDAGRYSLTNESFLPNLDPKNRLSLGSGSTFKTPEQIVEEAQQKGTMEKPTPKQPPSENYVNKAEGSPLTSGYDNSLLKALMDRLGK